MKKIILFSLLCFSLFFANLKISRAADSFACQCNGGNQYKVASCDECVSKCANNQGQASCVKVATTGSGGGGTQSTEKLPNPLGTDDINEMIARIINFVLSLVGSVSLLLFIYGGLTWMTSGGAAPQVKKGKDIIIWAVIGLAVVFSSYLLVKFVITGLAS